MMKKRKFDDLLKEIFYKFPGMWHLRKKISGIVIAPEKKIKIGQRAKTILDANGKDQKILQCLGKELFDIVDEYQNSKAEREETKQLLDYDNLSSVLHEFVLQYAEIKIWKNKLAFYLPHWNSDDDWEEWIEFDNPKALKTVKQKCPDLLCEFLDFVLKNYSDHMAISNPKKIAEFFAKNKIEWSEN